MNEHDYEDIGHELLGFSGTLALALILIACCWGAYGPDDEQRARAKDPCNTITMTSRLGLPCEDYYRRATKRGAPRWPKDHLPQSSLD